MVRSYTLTNGLVVLVESIPHVESVAYDLLIPGGIITDDPEHIGAALILGELTSRGAGNLSSRELSEAFENAGIRHAEGGGHNRFTYRGSALAENLPRALELVSHMVIRPALPEDEIENIRGTLLQDIRGLQDNPGQRAIVELTKRYYPEPFGRPSEGTEEGLKACGIEHLRGEWERRFGARGSILSVAGKVQPDEVLELAERYFGEWGGQVEERPSFGSMPEHRGHHIESDSAQMQIVLAYPAAKFSDPRYYPGRVATGVLSGGMFGRLFVEVREKRGLCYSVYARHSAGKDTGAIFAYAGTTPERAHETLRTLVQELRGLRGTVTPEELERSKANILSAIIIGEESTSSRAVSNAVDYWILGKTRDLDDVKRQVQAVTAEAIDQYCDDFPADSMMAQTLGPSKLDFSSIGVQEA